MTNKQLPEQFNDPEKYRLLESGAILEIASGKLVGNIGGRYTITKENASAMARERYRQTAEAVGQAVLKEVKSFADVPTNTPRDAFAFIAGKQAVALVDSDKPRVEDLERLGQLMGEVPRTAELRALAGAEDDPIAHYSEIEILREILNAAKAVREINSTAEREIIDVLPTG